MVSIPETHSDLFDRPILAALGTIQPDGSPQITPVWVSLRDGKVLINTAAGRRKYKNLLARKQATVMLSDPENDQRYIEVRGFVSQVVRNAEEDINFLSRKYVGTEYQHFVEGQERVTFLIEPTYVYGQ